MSINPPQQIADFFGFLTGMPWPEADEDLMRTVANDYYAVAEDLTILEGYIGQLVPIVLEHFEGDAAESYAAAMRDLIGGVSGPNTMQQTSRLSHDLGDAARNVANQVEYTKLMAIIQVVELLVQVLVAMFFSPFTFGGSFFNIALEFAFTREALKNLFIWLLRTIASQTFMGVAGGIFQDMLVQVYQLSSHHTDKWNTESTIQSLEQGALGGLFAGPLELFGQGVGKLLGKLFGKGAGSVLSKKIESSIKAGMNGLENSAEHFAENAGRTVGHAALDAFGGLAGNELKSLGKKTVGELAETAAGSGVRGAAKAAAEGAGQTAERDVAKLAGKLGDDVSRRAFAKEVGNLLGAAVPQIEAGFVRFGSGTVAEAFADKMGTIFEKHLADAADPLLRGEANTIGRDFGEAFARNWGRLGADHSGLDEAMSQALGGFAEHKGLGALAHGLPDLFTPTEITGNALSKFFQRMFEEHPLHGNALYQLGHSVGEMLKDGLENNLNEGAYNLVFMEDHQFTTSWNTFVSGAAMGLIGKTLHKLFEPAMTRYQEWLRDRQFRDNPDDSTYFGLLHPLNFVSFVANMSGHSAPFPVPRPTSHDIDASAGETAKDLLKWFFGNPLSGFDFRTDAPVVNWFTSSDEPAAGEGPAQDATAERLGGIRTSGGTDSGITGVTGDGTAPGHDEESPGGAPTPADDAMSSLRPAPADGPFTEAAAPYALADPATGPQRQDTTMGLTRRGPVGPDGDGAHIPGTRIDGGTEHRVRRGYERDDAADAAELSPLTGAVKFGAEENGGPSQPNRVPSGAGNGPAPRNLPSGDDQPSRVPRHSGADPATGADRPDRRPSPTEPREQSSERANRRDAPDEWRAPASPDDSSVASTPTATGSAQPETPDSPGSSGDESLASEVHAFDEMAITTPAMPTPAAPAHALPAPPPGFPGNEAFRQAIGGDRRIGRRLREDEYLRFVEETGQGGGRALGFVVNTMVSHEDVGQIRDVLDAITQGMEGMADRVAVVVGVNAKSGEETQLNAAVRATRRAVADLGLPVAVVSATFKPKGGRFPYGKMRNAVMHDEATRQLIGAMVKNGLHPYLSVQDFDRGSRITAEGSHIFNRVEQQLKIEDGNLPPVRPLAYIGGYRMPDRADLRRLLDETVNRYPKDKIPPQLLDRDLSEQHLKQLAAAVRKDMIARQNQANIHPLLPYAPEPNLFVDGAAVLLSDDRGGPRLSWGEGAAEFARLGQDLNQLNGWELRQYHGSRLDGRPDSVPVPDSRLPSRENPSMPLGRDEVHAQVSADAANNRLPHRGEAFRTDFVDGATSTDLSRLAQTLIDKNGVLAQTHANLTTVLDRLFSGKSAKEGVELAAVRKTYAPRSRDVYETEQPLRPRMGGPTAEQPADLPMASKLGDKPANVLNSAVSAPVGGPFAAEAGIQSEHKLHASLELALSTEDLILGRKLAYLRFEPDILGHRELSRLDVFPTRPRPAQGAGRQDGPVPSGSDVPADGDCLYHAVNAVRGIDVGSDTALRLRNTVLDWMLMPDNLSHVVRFANEQGVDISDLATTIAVSGNWHGPAGDLAATMVASALNATLVIEAYGAEHTVQPLRVPRPGRSRQVPPGQLIRLRLSDDHYEPVGRTVLDRDEGGSGRTTKRSRDPEDGPGRGTKRSNTSDARRTEAWSAGPSRPRPAGRHDSSEGGGASARQHRDQDTEMTDATPTKGVRKFGGADGTPEREEGVAQPGGDLISEMVQALIAAHASGTRLLQGEGSDPGLAAAVTRFPRDERFFSIAIHTGSGGTPVWNGREVTPAEFAVVLAELHERGVWDGETPLQFPACRFGDEHEYSFAAETMLLLHEQLPHLPLEAYAPDGDLWHVPSVLPTGGLDHEGPGHLVVGDGVVLDSSGRPRVIPGGGWLRMTVDRHDGELFVDALGAHLVVDAERRPNAQPVPPGYTLFEGGSHAPLDQAVSFGRRAAEAPGIRTDEGGDEPPGQQTADRDRAHWVGDDHPDASVRALTQRALTRFPDAERYFTVAMHTGAEHRPVRDGEAMSAETFAEHLLELRDSGAWDGERPLRLVACELAADPSFVADAMKVLWDRGVRADAFASDGPVWFTPLHDGGSELVATMSVGFRTTPDGVKPALLPGSEWVRFSPPAEPGAQPVTERVGPLLRPRDESPFVDAGRDEHPAPADGAVAFGADQVTPRTHHEVSAGESSASAADPPPVRTGGRQVPSRDEARPSVMINDYRVVTPPGGEQHGGSPSERSRTAAFTYRDAYGKGGQVVQTGHGYETKSFPVHRAVRSLVVEEHPQVRVSHDGSLALGKVAGRAKEFYALPEVVERGNFRLRQNGSEARLVLNEDVSIEFERDGRTVRLFKVVAEFSGEPSGVCRDFSRDVLGGTHTHAVLHDMRSLEEGGKGETSIAFVNTASNREIGGTHHLVAGLMDSLTGKDGTPAGPDWAKARTEKARSQSERKWPTPGEAYGSVLNRVNPARTELRAEFARKVRSIGINEEAWAQVGEAYLIQAISHGTDGVERLFTHDFSRTPAGASAERPITWGYHFAPVVVESLDGTHQITLENARYNRRSRELLTETLTATIEHYGPRIEQIRGELEQQVERGELSDKDPRLDLAQRIMEIREAERGLAELSARPEHSDGAPAEERSSRAALLRSDLDDAKTHACRALLAIAGDDMGRDGDMWWFSMVGRAKGESFFEDRSRLDEAEAQGAMTNPVVLALTTDMEDRRFDLEPDPVTNRLSSDDDARLTGLAGRIAKGALWNHRQGLPLPEIRVTSHALPGERSQGVAQRETVSSRLRELLDVRLEEVQRQDASIAKPLRARDLRVVADLRIRAPERVRALVGGDADMPVHSLVRIEAQFDQQHPAERIDHSPEQLTDLAVQTGLHRRSSMLGVRGGQPTAPPDVLERMRDIIRVGRRLGDQDSEPDIDLLTGVRRLSDVLAREYGHTGELRMGHLDPLVRDVLGLGFVAEITTADRVRLLETAGAAKVPGRPITVESLTRTYARLRAAGGAADTEVPAGDVRAGLSSYLPGSDLPGSGFPGSDSPGSQSPGQGPSLRLPVLDWWTSMEVAGSPSEPPAADHPLQEPETERIGHGAVPSARPEYGTVPTEAFAAVGVLEISPQYAEQVLGIPLHNQRKLQQMADDQGIVIEVRPTNPDSVPHLERGAMPKPVDIKAKTISDDDIWLGAKAEHKGLVGFFEPEPPRRTPEIDAEPGRFDRVMARYRQRITEHAELRTKMAKLEAEQRFRVVDGVVEGRDASGTWRQVAGDHDIFDLHDPDGFRTDQDTYEASVSAMVSGDMGVMHGAHMFWEPGTPFDQAIFDKIVKSHQPGGEELLRFVPGMKRPILSTAEPEPLSSNGRADLGPFAGDPRRHAAAAGGEPLHGWVGLVTEGEQPAGDAAPHEPSPETVPESSTEPEAFAGPEREPLPEPEPAPAPVVPTEVESGPQEPSSPHPRSVADAIAAVLAPVGARPNPPTPSGPAAAGRPARTSEARELSDGAVHSAPPQDGTTAEQMPVSRVGELPIAVPAGVDVTIDGRTVAVKGPKGSLTHTVAAPIEIAKGEDGTLLVTRPNDERDSKALHGLSRTLVANMITGVTAGYSKQLEISGVGYRVQAKGANLEFALGYSHPITVQAPEGISFKVESPTKFSVEGIDKQKVAEVAADIRKLRIPAPYQANGVRYAGEVTREAGRPVGR